MTYTFNEKAKEYHAKEGIELPVMKSAKYNESKAKAIELIDSKKYGLAEADFWILMNATKTKKMMYTGLIISHNACLKINDNIENKFKPECVIEDKDGYNGSLVYKYVSPDQGIFEVGEISKSNCKNDYPYAMAFKRLFDRVVLKLSKIAFYGIYSETENDEFKSGNDEPINSDLDLLEGLKACSSLEELRKYYMTNLKNVKDKKAFEKAKDLRKEGLIGV